ncbi:MAG: hypothetical protein FJW26_17510 [Acidimicrobiia bacterium]|nr:hypothetical protein [Acidimicrobiia bacterium]
MSEHSAPAGREPSTPATRWTKRDRPILAYCAMLFAAVALVLNYFIKFPGFPEEAVASFLAFRAEARSLRSGAASTAQLQPGFGADSACSSVLVLEDASFTLVNARVARILNRRSCWQAYRGPGSRLVVFQEYPGNRRELPEPKEIHQQREVRFYVYSGQDARAVFWERAGTCWVLVSDTPAEELLKLARKCIDE